VPSELQVDERHARPRKKTIAGDRDKLYWGLTGLYYISERSEIPFRYYETGSPFEYEYVRYIHLKWRQVSIER